MLFLKLIALLLTILISNSPAPAIAKEKPFLKQDDLEKVNITQFESINPNLLIYPLKRWKENIQLHLLFDKQAKNQYLWELMEIRFKELVYIIDFNKIGFIAFSTDRYNTTIGRLKAKGVTVDGERNETLKSYITFLEKMRDRYHSGSVSWEKLQQSVDTTKGLL